MNRRRKMKNIEILDFNKVDLRKIMLYEFTNKTKSNDVANKVNQATGRQTLTKVTVRRWFKKFEKDDYGLIDKPRKGRPRVEVNTDDVVEMIDQNPNLTIGEISNELKISDKTIRKRLRDAGYIYYSRRWIQVDDEDENEENCFYQLNE